MLYVIILSAALDLVGPSLPKAIGTNLHPDALYLLTTQVLLFDVIPSFLTKLLAPYFIHLIPYSTRIILISTISAIGMLLVALTPSYIDGGSIVSKMVGVMLASAASGGGEVSFLGLTHYYGQFSLAAWGSGTGAAGLVGAGAYALATTSLGMSVKSTLLTSSFLPIIMLVAFFLILPREILSTARYEQVSSPALPDADDDHDTSGLLSESPKQPQSSNRNFLTSLRANLLRSRALVFPYMLPLLLVYIAEYTINQGISPTLLFPLDSSSNPFTGYRSFYPTYNAIYQFGVFISRSSTPVLRIHHLYAPSLLQVANMVLLIAQSLWWFIPNVWFVFLVVFWEGLLGGAVYVNAFAEILENVPENDREFSLGATSVSDSAGVCIAGFLSLALEPALCRWQVGRGRDWCRRL